MALRIAGRIVAVFLVFPGSAFPEGLPGYEVVEFEYNDGFRQLTWLAFNDCGEAVFFGGDGPTCFQNDIYLYDNGAVRRITYDNDNCESTLSITDDGTLGWARNPRTLVVYRDGVEREALVSPEGVTMAAMNRHEDWAWSLPLRTGCQESDSDMMLLAGGVNRHITNGGYLNVDPGLNDLGSVFWSRYDLCSEFWPSRVMWYDGSRVEYIGPPDVFTVELDINNRNQLLYAEAPIKTRNPYRAMLWDRGVAREIIPAPCSWTFINDLGNAVGRRVTAEDGSVNQLWFYDALTESLTRVTDDQYMNSPWGVNNHNEVWIRQVVPGRWKYRHMRRIRNGESDFDGDVDLDDAASLHDCLTGPGDFDRLCDCRFLDIDHDRDVDLGDFVLFQRNYTGSK
jgi:hypothetical protein